MVKYGLNPTDMKKFREGVYQVARLHFAAGAKQVLPGIHGMPWAIGPDELESLREATTDPRAYVAILSHLFGGCVIGANPDESVCDEHGKVRGYEGLYVADASTIPNTIGVNPQHTIMGLARTYADQMLASA